LRSRRFRFPILALFAILVPVGAASAQIPTEAETPPASDSLVRRPPSPRGAFARSVVLPGWGQVAYDANVRAGLYFTVYSGSWFMLLKTMSRLGEAKRVETDRLTDLREYLVALAAVDTTVARRIEESGFEIELEREAERNDGIRDIRALVGARSQQREDWITFTVFWALISGVDAFVNAHLSDFPGELRAIPQTDGGVSLGFRFPAGRTQ